MEKTQIKKEKRQIRHTRIRAKVAGTKARPRLAFFRSNTAISAQLIDDSVGKTLAAVSTRNMKKGTLSEKAKEAGKDLAQKAKAAGITKVVFDRGGFLYTGNVTAFADGAREGGLEF